MRTFQFFVDDDRYSVPTLSLVTVKDDRRAREWADRLMSQSEHHRGVEVCEGGIRLFGIGSFAADRRTSRHTRERADGEGHSDPA